MDVQSATRAVEAFLRVLGDTGAAGFEGLVALLLQAATGQEFRLASPGRQRGRDASAESGYGNRIKMEAKHAKRIDLRELLSEIDESAESDKSLDIWALATSRSVDDQIASSLDAHAEQYGIDVLILDFGINGLPRLAVLMAAFPDLVMDWARRHNLQLEAGDLRDALSMIAGAVDFGGAKNRLLAKLLGTAGYDSARRRSQQHFLAIVANENNARAAFRQSLGIRKPDAQLVRRVDLTNSLNRWWDGPEFPQPAVILGEEGAGKTWATFDWAINRIESGDMPIVLPFAAVASELSMSDPLGNMLPNLLARWTGALGADRWARRLTRWLESESTNRPLILLIADGLNERADRNWRPFFDAILSDPWRQRIAVLATDRPGHWHDRCSMAGLVTFDEILLRGYSDAELSQALSKSHINYGQIPPALLPLVSLPRYCGLVVRHFGEMIAAGDFTRERLIYIEVKDRQQSKVDYPLTDERLFEIIRDLAEQARKTPDLNPRDLRALISTPGGSEANIYEEIIGGGILIPTGQGGMLSTWRVEPTRLIFGFGMLLADDLARIASGSAPEIREYLESWFEPQRDMDRKVEICGSALFHALFRPQYPEVGLRELIRYWLSLRNWAETAQLAFTGYVARRPVAFLDVAEEFWSSDADSAAAQEFLRASFIANRDNPAMRPLLEQSIRRWMGFVHASGRRPADQDAAKDRIVTREIEARAGCPLNPGGIEVAGTQLVVILDLALLRLGRFGLLIMSAGDALPFIGALANWAVASAVMDDGDFNDLVSWVVRLSDTDVDSILVAEARRLVTHDNPVGREAARLLLRAISSKQSRSLIDEYDLTPEWYKKRLTEHAGDPCKSFYAWNEEEAFSCLGREDVGLYRILEQAKSILIDPLVVPPASLIQRARDALVTINPSAIRASSSHTAESHALEIVTPILCAHAPRELADFMRSVVRTMPTREINSQYFLAMMLPKISLLLTASETNAVLQSIDSISANASEWSETEISGPRHMAKHAEARALSAIAPHLTPSDYLGRFISRSVNAFDSISFELWFEPAPHGEAERAIRLLHEPPNDPVLRRLLWVLPYLNVKLSEQDRDLLVQLAASEDAKVRAGAMCAAVVMKDESLARRMIDLGRRADENTDLWEEHWLTQLLAQFGGHLSLEEIAKRLRPSAMGFVIVERGNSDEEVDLFAECMDEEWRKITSALDPQVDRLPELYVETNPARSSVWPELHEPERSVTIRYGQPASWTSGRPSSPNADLKKLAEEWNNPEERTREVNADRRRRVSAILTAWRTAAFQWFGRTFSARALDSVYQRHPALVEKWIRPALDESPVGVSARRRLGAFLGPVSLVLLNRNPSLGFGLWQALHRDQENPAIIDTTAIPFNADDTLESGAARRTILEEATNDVALARVAANCERFGRRQWLENVIRELTSAERLWRKAKGLALASFSEMTRKGFEELVSHADLAGTWVEEESLAATRENVRTNDIARRRYAEFLASDDIDVAWGALTIALSVADERMLNWYEDMERSAPEPNRASRRRRFLELGWNTKRGLAQEVDREGSRRDRFFGIKFQRGEIAPFTEESAHRLRVD